MLRRPILIVLAAVFAGGAAPSGSGADAPPAVTHGLPHFVVTGHGWGHGVGMSQYGAYGYAQHGATYSQIVAHYYPGTQLGRAPVSRVRVLLGSAASVTISASAAVKVTDAEGTAGTLQPGAWKLGPTLKLRLPDAERAQELVPPVTFTSASGQLRYNRAYRGSLVLTSDGKQVTVVNNVGLEQYLYGVVPSEMPFDWDPEALKAQAVVARSYALAVRKSGGTFDLYPDTRSQVYRGVEGEKPSSNAAVDATAGQVLTYQGKVAVTYFFSTSGGRTAAINDVWNSQPVAYLVSVPDPYDSISPHHDWGPLAFSAAAMRAKLKVPGKLVDVRTTINGSARVSSVTALGTGGEATVAGGDVRRILDLQSTWFRVGVLALDPLPAAAVPFGTVATLTGLGRSLSSVRLEQRAVGASVWQTVGALRSKAGRLEVAVKASAPTQFRLVSGPLTTEPTSLRVAPKVRLQVPTAPTALGGSVKPLLAKAPVWIQRTNAAGGWTNVATTRIDERGRFVADLDVKPGTYRARVAPGRGWATAFSPELQVVGP